MDGRTIVMTRSGCAAAHSWQSRSHSVLSRAYGKLATPRTGSSSVSGTGLSGNAPYALADVDTLELRQRPVRARRRDVADHDLLGVLAPREQVHEPRSDVPGASGD